MDGRMTANPFLRILADELDRQGVKYEQDWLVVGVKVPIAFAEQRLAVFVDPCADGCGCPEHYLGMIETDKDEPYNPPFGGGRDGNHPFGPDPTKCSAHLEQQTHRLADAGWKVLRFWEHDVDRSPDEVARKIYDLLDKA